MPTEPIVFVAFASIHEAIPLDFADNAKPPHAVCNERQIQKVKSRKMATFLLHQLFKKANLETSQLNNIQKTASGRPYILNAQVDFNITHSGEYVAVILSVNKNKIAVGIDLEHPRKIRRFEQLIHYYANKEEVIYCNQLGYNENIFYLSWCLREAVLKAQGVGIVKLSEVAHFPEEKVIQTAYCPKGIFHFYTVSPFYFGYFFAQNGVSFSPVIFEYRGGDLQKRTDLQPLVYQVN